MIVIGLGFGDEGKGLTTSYLCSKSKNPLVVRFNGGHQAGHTVIHNGHRHVFSSLGSGTLQGAPSYFSHYCTFYPTAFLNEYYILGTDAGITPRVILNPLCPVTTPYDVAYNKKIEDDRGTLRHGSVGVGFGATLQRQEDFFKLYVQDLKYPKIVKAKLNNIAKHYGFELDCTDFLRDIKQAMSIVEILDYDQIKNVDDRWDLIFEGAQGVLLDQDFGFFPNVTRSNTTSKNALDVWSKMRSDFDDEYPEIYYVTRSYQTRHGAGFMSDESDIPLTNNENETNVTQQYQEEFRTGWLDPEMINYAIRCDNNFSRGLKKNLIITCMDQHPIDVMHLVRSIKEISIQRLLVSTGPSYTDIMSMSTYSEKLENISLV